MKATHGVDTLVQVVASGIGQNKGIAAFLMLLVGLLITMGIGSSFSTVPIIATIYVPLCLQLGFSPMAIIALVGTAGALGDAGSPASDSTLGPTSGLNADGQPLHGDGFALKFFIDPGHDLEQRRLARAIETQHANFGTRKKREGNVFQELALGRHHLCRAAVAGAKRRAAAFRALPGSRSPAGARTGR